MNRFCRFVLRCALCVLALLASSCSGIIGYGVVLWTIPEQQIADGEVVAVYVKSSISKEYVIGVPGSDQKISVPLWKLSEPASKAKAKRISASYAGFAHEYARCTFDGLPIRESSRTVAKQVYRLRKDEVIRVLGRGEGETPTNGTEEFVGEWLSVLTSDGTTGWCFSQNLALITMNADGSYEWNGNGSGLQEQDALLEAVLASRWYPDYYSTMIRTKEIDLDAMRPEFGFDTGTSSGTVAIALPDLGVSYPFEGVTRTEGKTYRFNDAPIQMTVRSEASIAVKYTDERGMPVTKNFVTLESDVDELITAERERREGVYTALRSFGPEFRSSSYGTLAFPGGGSFTWSGYSMLVPSVIAGGAGTGGTVEVRYFLPQSLAGTWDGILTFRFTGMTDEVNFFYKKESNGLRLCVARVRTQTDTMTSRDVTTITQPAGAAVLFFVR